MTQIVAVMIEGGINQIMHGLGIEGGKVVVGWVGGLPKALPAGEFLAGGDGVIVEEGGDYEVVD